MNSITTSGPGPKTSVGRLYLIRGVVALLWAGLLATALSVGGSSAFDEALPALVIGLLIAYPVIDVVASVIDAWSARRTAPTNSAALWANAGISVGATVAIAAAAGDGADAILRVFGIWALLTGLIQLALGILRRRRGAPGQLPMVLSGSISSLAGFAFVVMAATAEPDLLNLAGYAAAGAVFFLVSAWNQRMKTPATTAGTRVAA